MENNIQFVDAQAMHKLHPGTFDAPTSDQLQQLKPGNFIKVCAHQERFWAEIILVDGEVVMARIDNNLLIDALSYNDIISLKKDNIYDILKPPPLKKTEHLSKSEKAKKEKKRGRGI